MPRAHWLRTAAVLIGLAMPASAGAQGFAPPSAEGAKAVGEAVRGWVAQQFQGMGVDAAAMPLKVVADGETYRLELGFGGTYFDDALRLGEGVYAVTVKPLDGGRWAVVSATLPQAVRADFRTPGTDVVSTAMVAMQGQETTGTFDPSLATPSSFTTTIRGYSTETTSPTGVQAQKVQLLTGRSEWQPAASPGRVTVMGDTTMEGYESVSPLPGGGEVAVTIRRMSGATRLENLDVPSIGSILRTAFALGAAGTEAKGNAGKAPAEKSFALALLTQMAGLMDAMDSEYTYEGIAIEGGNFAGTLRQFTFGLAMGAPDGKVGVRLKLGAEGLDSPMIPDGPWRDLVPHKVTLTPRVSGVPKEALMAYLRRSIETEGKDMEGEGVALIAANPVLVGLDDVLIDVGPMRLKAVGAVRVAAIDDAAGEAEIRASGFDAMIRKVNGTPELKAAAPVMIFLKGIAKQEGTETVWKITYADRKLVVNDTDMSDLMPAK
jgi:hypothetical protein